MFGRPDDGGISVVGIPRFSRSLDALSMLNVALRAPIDRVDPLRSE
jgi:hypothetical protein